MAVPSSGELKLWNSIWNPEIGGSKGDNSLHSASIYAGFSTPDAMSDFYGWSDVEAPSVSTSAASAVTQSSMTANGNVSNTGGENVSRGFYFGTSTTYTSNTKYTLSGTQGTGGFSRSMTGLSAGTTYYINAWASNGAGETVGNQVSQATYVNFSPSFNTAGQFYSFGFVNPSPSAGGSIHSQYNDPNVGYITHASNTLSSSQRNTTLNLYNNTTSRGYSSISFPTAQCPTAQTNAWQIVVCSIVPGGCSGGGGGAHRYGNHGIQPYSYQNEGGACVGGQYYLVTPTHWADRIYNGHGVVCRHTSDIRLKTNISYL